MATSARGPPGAVAVSKEGIPNRTLYVRNLPDKLQKEDLKRNLYMLFATYGVILDIVALKTMKMRGQAHVVFRDVDSSTQAMRALQAFTFFGKDMVRLARFYHGPKRILISVANYLRKDKVRHHREAGRNVQDA
ncbi:U2 small nuclear ribonucleoprotein [Pyrenophora tritici-repentis]|nr:U2 small nuclear ribonucleoprotein [Pyrenophora tritici-repentis]